MSGDHNQYQKDTKNRYSNTQNRYKDLPKLIDEIQELRKEHDMLSENLYQLVQQIDELEAKVPNCYNRIVRIRDTIYIVNKDDNYSNALEIEEGEE